MLVDSRGEPGCQTRPPPVVRLLVSIVRVVDHPGGMVLSNRPGVTPPSGTKFESRPSIEAPIP